MTDRLYQYLKQEWARCNAVKYQKYFDEWVSNLTDDQIYYFSKYWMKG